jgi:hypothetical protein
MLRLIAGLVFAALLLASPVDALAAARQAISVWAVSFVPALLPFFAVTPALSSDEAAGLYQKIFGRVFQALFGCPGQLSGAALIGLMAGSPAGAIAAERLRGNATSAELARGALLASGVSPGFLISAVGAAMLGDSSLGAILFRAQLGALLLGGLILRRAFTGGAPELPTPRASAPKGDIFLGAATAMISVCAHMVVFAVGAHVIARLLPDGCEAGVLSLAEVSGGCAALAAMPLARALRMLLLAFTCGFGGLAIMVQNLGRLPGVKWHWYLSGKMLHGVLCVGFCWVQLGIKLPAAAPVPSPWQGPVVAACALVVLTFAGVFFTRRAWYNAGTRKKG